MIRRQLTTAIALAAALSSFGAAAQGSDYSKVEIKTTRLSDTVYMLQGAGGNIGLSVGDDAVFMIDDQYAPLAPKIKAAVARLTPKPLKFLLNTHFHFDHTGGNETLGGEGALIFAHDNVRRRLRSDQLIGFINAQQPAAKKEGLPVVTVASEIRFHLNGEEIHAFHAPHAHTDGDLIVHFLKSDVVHMGDTYFNGLYPFIDASSGGGAEGVVAAVNRVLQIVSDNTKIIPGHGPLATRVDLLAYRNMLESVTSRVKALRREGKSEAEIVATKPTASFDGAWGGGFIKPDDFVRMLIGATEK